MHRNIRHLLDPGAIAIVGANDKGNVGARTLRNTVASGFAGRIYPVNPNYAELDGLTCYPSLTALPEVPDQVVISVPVGGALRVLSEAAAARVPAVVFFSEGFADAGTKEGASRNTELLEIAAQSGMAVSGPNSMGILSLRRHFASTFMNLPDGLTAGGISIVSQSGGLINAVTELGRNRRFGFNYLISAGNEAVVNSADYLRWLAEDDGTDVIISILEGVKDGPAFRSALEYATARKPVVVMKLGRSELGQRATMAHTGSLAGGDDVFRALCRQSGALVADTLDSLLETAAIFLGAPLPRGDRVVVFSTSGGATVLTTDLGVQAGLKFPPLSKPTNDAMQKILEVGRPFTNPFDVVGNPRIVKGDNMTRCLDVLVADDDVDAIGFVLVLQRDTSTQRQKLLDQIRAVAARSAKPIVVIPEMTAHWRNGPPDAGVPVAGTLRDGLVALRGLIDYAAYRRKIGDMPAAGAGTVVSPRLTPPAVGSILTEHESKTVLGAAGLPVTREHMARSAEETVARAREVGFPVALKVQSPALMHKSDAGVIALGLGDTAAVAAAYERLTTQAAGITPTPPVDGILVQEMVAGGIEFLLGMTRDPILGPVVVFGPGGVFVELLGTRMAMRLPPFSLREAEDMVGQSCIAEALLAGFRGRPAGDRDALVRLIADFAGFVAGLGPEVAAIDLNPVIVLPPGQGVRIVDAAIEFTRTGK